MFSVNGVPAATYIPFESVIAVGEMKSWIGIDEIDAAVSIIERAKTLRRYQNDPVCIRNKGLLCLSWGRPSRRIFPEK